jgi:hypothetical protein
MQYAANMSTHQAYYTPSLDAYMALLLGVPEFNSGEKSTEAHNKVTVLFHATQDMVKTVKNTPQLQPYIIVVNTKKRARYWKQQLRQALFRGAFKGEAQKNIVVTLNKLMDMPPTGVENVIFPEFLNINTLQPLHQHRIQSKGLDEAGYINHIFNAKVSSVKQQLSKIGCESLTLNIDPSLKSFVQLNH